MLPNWLTVYNPFHFSNDRAHRILRRNNHHYVYMVGLYVAFDYLTTRQLLHNLRKKFYQISFHARIQDAMSIFRYPDYVIFRAICCMPG